jgi:hypothetical protein
VPFGDLAEEPSRFIVSDLRECSRGVALRVEARAVPDDAAECGRGIRLWFRATEGLDRALLDSGIGMIIGQIGQKRDCCNIGQLHERLRGLHAHGCVGIIA